MKQWPSCFPSPRSAPRVGTCLLQRQSSLRPRPRAACRSSRKFKTLLRLCGSSSGESNFGNTLFYSAPLQQSAALAQTRLHWGGGWGARAEGGTEWSWERRRPRQTVGSVFHSQQPPSLTQACALPVAAAVTQLDEGVNSHWLISTRCSVSETGYLTNECQMLSPNLWTAPLAHGEPCGFEVRV